MTNVYLIGAGPGNPKLISIRATECLGMSDVVLYDRLVNREILKYSKVGAKLIYVGKRSQGDSQTQNEINELILSYAQKGYVIARLKGGDPFLFGRGGEEAQYLLKHGIKYEIVPGITSAISVPGYAGIPVTHRSHSASVHIISGSEKDGKIASHLDYKVLGKIEGTLVFLMGVRNLKSICEGLISNGKSRETPVAVIEKGTTNDQRVVVGKLYDICEITLKNNIKSPSIIVIGDVVNLQKELEWFVPRRHKVLITRDIKQSGELIRLVEESGFDPVVLPMIDVASLELDKDSIEVLKNISIFNWILFSSSNAVEYFFRAMHKHKIDYRNLARLKIIAIGNSTSDTLIKHGFHPDFIPIEHSKRGISSQLTKIVKNGDHIIIPGSDIANNNEFNVLDNIGVKFTQLNVYRTSNVIYDKEEFTNNYTHDIKVIMFTSPSSIQGFIKNVMNSSLEIKSNTRVICIGKTTKEEAEKHGLTVYYTAERHSIKSMVDGLKNIDFEV